MTKKNQNGNGIVFKDSKIAEGPPAEFNDTDNKADEIKDISNIVNQNMNTAQNSQIGSSTSAYTTILNGVKFYNDNKSIDNIRLVFAPFRTQYTKGYTQGAEEFDTMIGESLTLYPHLSIKKLSYKPVVMFKIRNIKDYLEQDSLYGQDLFKSGLYEQAGLSSSTLADNNRIEIFGDNKSLLLATFPELEPIYAPLERFLRERYWTTDNPNNSLFMIPLSKRRIFTEATAMKYQGRLVSDRMVDSPDFPLTSIDIYKYAQSIGKVEKTAEFTEMYREIKKLVQANV